MRKMLFAKYLVRASVVEDGLQVFEIDVAELVQPEVVDGSCRRWEHVLLESGLEKPTDKL